MCSVSSWPKKSSPQSQHQSGQMGQSQVATDNRDIPRGEKCEMKFILVSTAQAERDCLDRRKLVSSF
jgi:hypothetical protein